ncbi:hypothetical protein BDR05DRAFT_964505 [Suillus weaverae]|nr:hypothetical protein BDR05DRAFT_964505 [Suillus weaverae]
MDKSSGGRLTVDSVSNIGPHYARTLREWRRRFVSRFKSVIVPALKAEHHAIINGPRGREEIQVFRRKWLCYYEVGFTARVLGDHIIIFTREGFEGFGCAYCTTYRISALSGLNIRLVWLTNFTIISIRVTSRNEVGPTPTVHFAGALDVKAH